MAQIWSLDGTIVQVLDRSKTLPMDCDPSAPEPDEPTGRQLRGYGNNKICVRDVSWHPQVRLWKTLRIFDYKQRMLNLIVRDHHLGTCLDERWMGSEFAGKKYRSSTRMEGTASWGKAGGLGRETAHGGGGDGLLDCISGLGGCITIFVDDADGRTQSRGGREMLGKHCS